MFQESSGGKRVIVHTAETAEQREAIGETVSQRQPGAREAVHTEEGSILYYVRAGGTGQAGQAKARPLFTAIVH